MYALQALSLSRKLSYSKGMADAYVKIGLVEDTYSNYDTSAVYFDSAVHVFEKINDKAGVAVALNNTGNSFRNRGLFDKSFEFYMKALKIRESIGDHRGISDSYNDLGNIFSNQGKYQQSLPYFHKAIEAAEKIKYESGIAIPSVNLGGAYKKIADQELESGKIDSSLFIKKLDSASYFINKAYGAAVRMNNKRIEAYSLVNIATVNVDLKKYDLALKNYLQSATVMEEMGDKYGLAYCMGGIGEIYTFQKKYPLALKYQDTCRQIAIETEAKDLLQQTYLSMSDTYHAMNDDQSAYLYHKKYADLKDSVLNEESTKQIAEMQTKYETEKKEQQINLLNKDKELQSAQLNRQQMIIWSVAGGLLTVLVLSIFIFRERRKSEKLLLNILPVETAKELKAKGKAAAKHYDSVTVMFTDFKGFTSIAEKLSAEELVRELDMLFKKFDEIISKYQIEKIKTIGDAYMCASGLPTVNKDHAEIIVNAALDMQEWVVKQNNQWKMRIGIHSGPVTAGVVGDKKFAFDIWGDTVNTASRMESSGEPNAVNVSEATYQLVKEKFQFESRGKIPAKNKGEIEMFYVKRK